MATNEQEKKNSPPEGEETIAATVVYNGQRNNKFILDSGATSHMCFNLDLFFEFTTQTDSYITLADDKPAKITGK
ncbi:hypothetical protein JTE90_013919 [Oedothorax gibbosus]|uniref:Retrovirus-related Pol polyprotein from transposon TNT 1-94-like beta-barrel domain-containing protein n=1 Tax=Oedothorax gibbosus TaxID=931172 RepID=A0AAV6UFK6_9ARAC|nr:hypothetical protein JTE90_013919 [Oedothorax gibbosus]